MIKIETENPEHSANKPNSCEIEIIPATSVTALNRLLINSDLHKVMSGLRCQACDITIPLYEAHPDAHHAEAEANLKAQRWNNRFICPQGKKVLQIKDDLIPTFKPAP